MSSNKRVNFASTEDIGIITHYKGEPFTGIAYDLHKNGKLKNEIQMISGLKHGIANVYDQKGNLSEQHNYIDDVYHGEQFYIDSQGMTTRKSYYRKGVFIEVIHFDKNGDEIKGFNWFNHSINGFNLKIRKFGVNGIQSFSPTLIWLEPYVQSVFFHLYTILMMHSSRSGLNSIPVSKFNDLKVLKYLQDIILDFKKNCPADYNQIFNDESLDDIEELLQYKMLLHPSFNANKVKEGVSPSELFKKEYLKIHKGNNKDYKKWLVLDNSVKPVGIVFQSDLKSNCNEWVNRWDD